MRTDIYALFLVSLGLASGQTIYTVAGLPHSHRGAVDGKAATAAPLNSVYGLLFDKLTGRLLFHDEQLVTRVEPDGTLVSLVGIGRNGDGASTDGTLASGLTLQILRGMAQDSTGALYLADAEFGRIYRVGLDGVVTTFAGGGPAIPVIDGQPATQAALVSPRGMVFDSQGNLILTDTFCTCLRRISPAGLISTVFTLPQQPGFFQYFEGLAIDPHGNLYATEYRGSVVWRIGADGSAAVIAGTGVAGFSGDGGPASAAQLNGPTGVALDSAGNIYIGDTTNNRVRRIAPDGTISTFAGTGVRGFSGDGGPAAAAQLSNPAQVILDSAGDVYIADYSNRRVRMVSTDGAISTIVGSGAQDASPQFPQFGDGGPALQAAFNLVSSAGFGPSGDLYVADMGNNKVRKIAPDGTITTVAGNGQIAYAGDGVPAAQVSIIRPVTVITDTAGTVYFATGDGRVMKVTPDGILHLVAGIGTGSGLVRSGGDNGPAVNAQLNEPKGLALDGHGNLYIGDTSNARLRKVDANGIITTVAGPGIQGQDYWNAVAVDAQGNLYVAITHSGLPSFYSVIDRVNADGTLTPVAGNAQSCSNLPAGEFPFDGVQAAKVPLCLILGMTFDAAGVLYIPESFYGAVLRVAPDGTIRRIAGSRLNTTLGDGGPAMLANLEGANYYSPDSVAFDAFGNMFLPQAGLNRIRVVMANPLALRLPVDHVNFQGGGLQSQTIQISTNVVEPLPFQAKVTVTGGAWLSTNRVTGQTGDLLMLTANSSGLAPGTYSGTVQISVPAGPATGTIPVTLTVNNAGILLARGSWAPAWRAGTTTVYLGCAT